MIAESKMNLPRRLGAFALAAIAVAACAPAPPAVAAESWRHDPVWDDGNAEFCAYEIDWPRYGALNPGRALTILVKEPWAPDLEVKADTPRPDGFEVLKLNFIRDVPTGVYIYHQMASVFLRRDDGSLRKLATSSTEGCGISTAEMTDGSLTTSSYFDGQGERRMAWPEGAVPEDALAAVLRDWVAGEAPATVRVFPSLLAGRFPRLEADDWRVSRSEVSGVEAPGAEAPGVEEPGGAVAGVELRLARGDEWQSWVFAAESPHRLLRLTRSDGSDYRLAKCERIPYWQMTGPGDEQWLPEAVRSP